MDLKKYLENEIMNVNGVIEPLSIRNTLSGTFTTCTPEDHNFNGQTEEEITNWAIVNNSDSEETLFKDHSFDDVRKLSSNMGNDIKQALKAMTPSTEGYEKEGHKSLGTGYYFYSNQYRVDSLAFGDLTRR